MIEDYDFQLLQSFVADNFIIQVGRMYASPNDSWWIKWKDLSELFGRRLHSQESQAFRNIFSSMRFAPKVLSYREAESAFEVAVKRSLVFVKNWDRTLRCSEDNQIRFRPSCIPKPILKKHAGIIQRGKLGIIVR